MYYNPSSNCKASDCEILFFTAKRLETCHKGQRRISRFPKLSSLYATIHFTSNSYIVVIHYSQEQAARYCTRNFVRSFDNRFRQMTKSRKLFILGIYYQYLKQLLDYYELPRNFFIYLGILFSFTEIIVYVKLYYMDTDDSKRGVTGSASIALKVVAPIFLT